MTYDIVKTYPDGYYEKVFSGLTFEDASLKLGAIKRFPDMANINIEYHFELRHYLKGTEYWVFENIMDLSLFRIQIKLECVPVGKINYMYSSGPCTYQNYLSKLGYKNRFRRTLFEFLKRSIEVFKTKSDDDILTEEDLGDIELFQMSLYLKNIDKIESSKRRTKIFCKNIGKWTLKTFRECFEIYKDFEIYQDFANTPSEIPSLI